MPWSKRRKFTLKDLKVEEFSSRQLNDTAYIARTVRSYLQCLYPPELRDHAVLTSRGGVTADLRWEWGLDSILDPEARAEKNRLDLRHHAVDAIVVALTDHRHIHALSQSRRRRQSEKWRNEPWEGFRQDVAEAVEKIIVSHRTQGRIRGALHDDTFYSKLPEEHRFTYRKPLKSLKLSEVSHIRDKTIKCEVLKRLGMNGEAPQSNDGEVNSDKPSKNVPPSVWREPIRLVNRRASKQSVPSVVKSVRLVKVDKTIKPIRKETAWVKTGSNHHFWFGETSDAKGRLKWVCEAITMLEAAERVARDERVIQEQHAEHPKAKFVMSLCPGDLLILKINGQDEICRFETAAGTSHQMQFRIHRATAIDKNGRIPSKKPDTLRACQPRKITVDPLGRVRWAHGSGGATVSDAPVDPRVLALAEEVVRVGLSNTKALRRLKSSPMKHLGAQFSIALRRIRNAND